MDRDTNRRNSLKFLLGISQALCFCLALSPLAPVVHAADADLKPGDTIGPNNWQRIQGMVGENFLNRIKAG
ncbi:MAG TPA: hypothetical protein VGK77_25350, partial [Candidatus Binatia bacterium]